ncbi:hypothetical protein J6590_008359 [Homalodisca vitripennis]|nr:hypothetical protein J6590_008359 [Homalodisca vitripennis]
MSSAEKGPLPEDVRRTCHDQHEENSDTLRAERTSADAERATLERRPGCLSGLTSSPIQIYYVYHNLIVLLRSAVEGATVGPKPNANPGRICSGNQLHNPEEGRSIEQTELNDEIFTTSNREVFRPRRAASVVQRRGRRYITVDIVVHNMYTSKYGEAWITTYSEAEMKINVWIQHIDGCMEIN